MCPLHPVPEKSSLRRVPPPPPLCRECVPAAVSLPCGLQGARSGHVGTFTWGSVSLGQCGHRWTPGGLMGVTAAPVPVPCPPRPPARGRLGGGQVGMECGSTLPSP